MRNRIICDAERAQSTHPYTPYWDQRYRKNPFLLIPSLIVSTAPPAGLSTHMCRRVAATWASGCGMRVVRARELVICGERRLLGTGNRYDRNRTPVCNGRSARHMIVRIPGPTARLIAAARERMSATRRSGGLMGDVTATGAKN